MQIICAMESLDGKDFLGYYHGLIHYAQTEFTLQKGVQIMILLVTTEIEHVPRLAKLY